MQAEAKLIDKQAGKGKENDRFLCEVFFIEKVVFLKRFFDIENVIYTFFGVFENAHYRTGRDRA